MRDHQPRRQKRPLGRRAAGLVATILTGVLPTLLTPQASRAQLGAIEAFARKVTDVSFYVNTGDLHPSSPELETGRFGLAAYGLELLFSIGEVERPIPGAQAPVGDTVRIQWTQTTVTRHGDHVDTTNVYEVSEVRRRAPSETIWLFEMGLGYGQVVGFRGAGPETDLRGTIRDLPSVSFYASYEPLGAYFGLRSGFMRVQGLQFYDESGQSISGKAESFLGSLLAGYAVEVLGFNLFLESGYALRHFPSVEWSGGSPSTGLPKDLNLSGWFMGTGIQFQIAG